MRVIPVADLAGGRAVHAVAGNRREYRPVWSPLVEEAGDILSLAANYHSRFALDELYLADLDALGGGARQRAVYHALAGSGSWATLWIDAGVTTPAAALAVLEDGGGRSRVVIALETLGTLSALRPLCDAVDPVRLAFSIDLRNGHAVSPDSAVQRMNPVAIATTAAAAGVRAFILIDVGRVGSSAGVDHGLVRALRAALPGHELIVGGGIRDRGELDALAATGADAALVATALHRGGITASDIAEILGR